jgi:hypothetical protein
MGIGVSSRRDADRIGPSRRRETIGRSGGSIREIPVQIGGNDAVGASAWSGTTYVYYGALVGVPVLVRGGVDRGAFGGKVFTKATPSSSQSRKVRSSRGADL